MYIIISLIYFTVNVPFFNMIRKKFDRSIPLDRLLCILLFILIFSAQVQAQLPACTISMTINDKEINPGDDNKFRVCLSGGVICNKILVTIEVTDPMGIKHEYRGLTGGGASPYCTPWADYLTQFDNSPNTDISGRYYVVARSPDRITGEEWDQGDFIVNVIACEKANDSTGVLMAEKQVTIENIPDISPSDIVACCHLGCCLNLTLDIDCAPIGGNFPLGDLTVGTTEPSSFGYTRLCSRMLSGTNVEYTSVNTSKYKVIGRAIDDSGNIHYAIVYVGKNGCILADVTRCLLATKRLLINETVYRNHVVNNLSRIDPLCGGFYIPEIDWPYHEVQNTSRYLAVYGNLTDFLYCYMAPAIMSESKWCHLINLGWYSVVDLTNKKNIMFITPESIEAEKEWNHLSGYIVLGHACPLYRNQVPNMVITGANDCFDAVHPPNFNIPCSSPPCIYVWQSNVDGTFGFRKSFCIDGLTPGLHFIELKVADSETDTQIPAFNLIKNSIYSIKSNVTVDMTNSACANVQDTQIFDYGPPYRGGDKDMIDFYRLFDKDTMWVKIFAVTPMLEDEKRKWQQWNWSRTSTPDDVNVTIYIGGGCKRTSAFLFNYTDGVHSYYETPIIDYVNVTIFDGQNPPVTYNVSGWNLLPFPPADSIVNISNGALVDHHLYEGIRYSYFAINHTIPENAAYLDIHVNYTCETTLKRNVTAICPLAGLCDIHDKSTVYDNFTIKFLDHENPKDNCRWTNPLEWRNISGYWDRTWDATLGKYVLHLNRSNIANRRMVSVENISDNKVMKFLVRGNAVGGDIADITIGFYSDETSDNYWFLDLHEDVNANLAIGKCVTPGGCSAVTVANPAVIIGNDRWYNVLIYLNNDNIYAKVWDYGTPEPVNWQINHTITPPNKRFGTYLVIGTEGGTDNEEFWFDPDPGCGINITGYYDPVLLPTGESAVIGGFVEIKIKPDILSGIIMDINKTARIEYAHVAHPAKHTLYRKEKAIHPPYPDIQEFYYDDKYGYESRKFGFNELCKLPLCPSNCYCIPEDIFSPECMDITKEPPEFYHPWDCICAINECYPDPCTSDRTYHEFEGLYYDFVDFYNEFFPSGEDHFYMVSDDVHRIGAKNISTTVDSSKVNSPEGTYQFSFSCNGINETYFRNTGKITVYTHFRNFTYNIRDVLKVRLPSNITYNVSPAPEDIEPGDLVTINLTLWRHMTPNPGKLVEVIVTNYEDELIGVSWIGDKAYVLTDDDGSAGFSFVIRKDTAKVTLAYKGDAMSRETQVTFLLGGEIVKSTLTSVEFFLLMIIFILAIFSYRFFKKGRLDFYEMWQEFRGEKD